MAIAPLQELSLKPTELQPHEVAEYTSAIQALRADAVALAHGGEMEVYAPLAFASIADALEALAARIERL